MLLALAVLAFAGFLTWSFRAYPGRTTSAQGTTAYDAATEVTLTGTIKEVKDFACPESEGTVGTHLLLQTPTGTMQVHLAPVSLVRSRHLSFVRGEQITVIGSEVRVFDRRDVLAREIRRGSETILIRDWQGKLIE